MPAYGEVMADPTITQRSARYRRKLIAERGMQRVEVIVPVSFAEDVRRFARSLGHRDGAPISDRPNTEAINDRAKLIYARHVARALRQNPALMDKAKEVVARWLEKNPTTPYALEWRSILNQGVDRVCAVLRGRSEEDRRIRLNSPFFSLPELSITNVETRRKLWRRAKLILAR
jgi:hypothetical protein